MNAETLKNSILQMAVQGKLVPQDPSDEPASVLLEHIREERCKLVEEGKAKAPKGGESVIYRDPDGSYYEKRGKGAPVCIDDEIPFEIPASWAWARLESVLGINRGGSPRPIKSYLTNSSEGVNWIKIGDTEIGGKYINQTKERIRPEGVKKSREVYPGDLLLTNSMSFGRPYITKVYGCVHDGWLVFEQPERSFDIDFIFHLLSSLFLRRQFTNAAAGAVVQNLNIDKVKRALVPIASISEQKRIATMLDKIMPIVERYGVLEDERESLDAKLPDRLRKSILQMAVQGKLVPQDPSDEPASVLLEHIREERCKLVEEGKAKAPKGGESVIYRDPDGSYYEKRGKGAPVCIDDEIPFEIPESWEWCRMESVAWVGSGQTPKTLKQTGTIPFFRVADMNTEGNERELISSLNYLPSDYHGITYPAGAIVYPKNGGAVFTNKRRILCRESLVDLNTGVTIPCLPETLPYFWLIYKTIDFRNFYSGSALPTISAGVVKGLLIPLPPREEQKRIVAKVEELQSALKGVVN